MQSKVVVVDVFSHDPRWRAALLKSLQQVGGITVRAGPDRYAWQEPDGRANVVNGREPEAAIVVAPGRDMPLALCRDLSAAGVRVIVLAAVPREWEQSAYLEAGAYAYLGMEIGNRELIEHISILAAAMADGDGAGS